MWNDPTSSRSLVVCLFRQAYWRISAISIGRAGSHRFPKSAVGMGLQLVPTGREAIAVINAEESAQFNVTPWQTLIAVTVLRHPSLLSLPPSRLGSCIRSSSVKTCPSENSALFAVEDRSRKYPPAELMCPCPFKNTCNPCRRILGLHNFARIPIYRRANAKH